LFDFDRQIQHAAAHVGQNEMLGLSGTGPESLNKNAVGIETALRSIQMLPQNTKSR
jgi:hypothetical protein